MDRRELAVIVRAVADELRAGLSSSAVQLATVHAPEGGKTVGGKPYKGGQFLPDENGEHAAYHAIEPGDLGFVQGYPVRRLDDKTWRLQEPTATGHVVGSAADVHAHIQQLHREQANAQPMIAAALARADAAPDLNPFQDWAQLEAEAAAFDRLPHGALVVSLADNTRGRLGKVVRTTDHEGRRVNKVKLHGIEGWSSGDVEPLDQSHSWRVPGREAAPAEKLTQGRLFSTVALQAPARSFWQKLTSGFTDLMNRLKGEPEVEEEALPGLDEVEFWLRSGEWMEVESTNVEAIRYLADDQTLQIEYKNHGFYQYQNINETEARDFALSPSKGGWVWDNLRLRGTVFGFNPKHPYSFISGPSDYEPQWMRDRASRAAHGAIPPSGAQFSTWVYHVGPHGAAGHRNLTTGDIVYGGRLELATKRYAPGPGLFDEPAATWTEYFGPRGGHGWRSSLTGRILYQTEKPGEHEHHGPNHEEPEPPVSAAQPAPAKPTAKEPWQMTKAEFEKKNEFSQMVWDDLRQNAKYVSKGRPDHVVTTMPVPGREGYIRVGTWDNRGPLSHVDIPEEEIGDYLSRNAYERGGKRVIVEGGIGGTWPSPNYAGAGFRVDSKGVSGVRSFVGPADSIDWISNRLASGGYKHRIEDVPEEITEKAGTKAFRGEKPLKDHYFEVADALATGKPVPPEVLADYLDLAPKAKPPEAEPIAPRGEIAPASPEPAVAEPPASLAEDWSPKKEEHREPLAAQFRERIEALWGKAEGDRREKPEFQDLEEDLASIKSGLSSFRTGNKRLSSVQYNAIKARLDRKLQGLEKAATPGPVAEDPITEATIAPEPELSKPSAEPSELDGVPDNPAAPEPSMIASESEIPLDVAVRAHSGTSFVPEDRGRQRQKDYASTVNSDHEELSKLVRDDAERELLNDEFARYHEGYRQRYLAMLHAMSRVMSSMITGPARFPVESNLKKGDTADKRRNELLEYRKTALAAIRRKLRPDQSTIRTDQDNAGTLLQQKIAKLEAQRDQWKKINAAHKAFLKDPASLDQSDLPEEGKAMVRNYKPAYSWEPHPIAPYQLTNLGAELRRLQGRVGEVQKLQESERKEEAYEDGIRVIENPEAGRIQLVFPGKPDEKTRAELKSRGFRWAPSEGAWQRHLNSAGRNAVEQVLTALGKKPSATEQPPAAG